MKKPITTALLKSLLNQCQREEITFSRMVEVLNEKAKEFYEPGSQVPFTDFFTDFTTGKFVFDHNKIKQDEKTSEVIINYHGNKETFKAQVVYKPNPKQIEYILDSHKKLYNPFNYEIKSVMIDGYLIDHKFYELK